MIQRLFKLRKLLESLLHCFNQVNSAVSLDHIRRQWIDLGLHSEACMTRPETCGEAGGAISAWVNLVECPSSGDGIVSSYGDGSDGSVISCSDGEIR